MCVTGVDVVQCLFDRKADLAQSLIIAILQIEFLKQPLKNKKL